MGLCNICANALSETPSYSIQTILSDLANNEVFLLDCDRCNINAVAKSESGDYIICFDDHFLCQEVYLTIDGLNNLHSLYPASHINKQAIKDLFVSDYNILKQFFSLR